MKKYFLILLLANNLFAQSFECDNNFETNPSNCDRCNGIYTNGCNH